MSAITCRVVCQSSLDDAMSLRAASVRVFPLYTTAAISTQEECDEECDLPVLYIAIAAVLGVLLGALLGAVSTAVVFKCCCSRGGEDKKDFIKLQPKS